MGAAVIMCLRHLADLSYVCEDVSVSAVCSFVLINSPLDVAHRVYKNTVQKKAPAPLGNVGVIMYSYPDLNVELSWVKDTVQRSSGSMHHLETDAAPDNAALTLYVLSDRFPLPICFGVGSLVTTLLAGTRFLTKVSGHLVGKKKKHRGAFQVARNILGTRISVP
jgi:hypothetical protein